MKTELKFTVGLLGFVCMQGCSSVGAGAGDLGEEETVGERTSALTYNDRVANGTRHDYNGDQIEDIIVSGPNGSTLMLGKVGGGFTTGAWSRSDLTAAAVEYVAGDFDGDHLTDLIVTTANGTSEFFGTTSGGLVYRSGISWVRYDLTKGSVKFTVGDFNRDGRSDLMASNDADGVVEYLGKASGGFDAHYQFYVTRDRIAMVAGDFNCDGASDLIYTVADQSSLDTGIADPAGGFNHNVWVSSEYPLHGVEFYVGNYNGVNFDGHTCDDVIAKTTVDARELLGIANGGFNPPIWKHPEWSLMNNVQFVPGDYNGDGKTDLVLSTGAGTNLLLGKSGGGFNSSTWTRSDVDSYHTAFARGDYSKDGRDDLIITLGTDPKNVPGSTEYLGQPSGAQPSGFTGVVWTDPNIVLSGGWAIY